MIWLLLAVLAAVFTSLTTILAKIGLKGVNSNFATAYRTAIIILCALGICLIKGSLGTIKELSAENYLFLGLSGVATGLSWIFYFKALKYGDVNKVAPIDKSSFILTSILFVIIYFDDTTNGGDPLTIGMLALSVTLIGLGTILMVDRKKGGVESSGKWLMYAVLSAVFASLVAVLVKLGLRGINSEVGTLIRTVVVLIFSVIIVISKKDYREIKNTKGKNWVFLTLSGMATGGAWLTEYMAINMDGVNPVAVSSIGKLSILLTMGFSMIVLKEKFSKKSIFGLVLLTAGIAIVTAFSL